MIETSNLHLISCGLIHAEAILRDKRELAEILQVTVPDGWPHFPRAYELLKSEPSPTAWCSYFFIHPNERALVGSGGFKGRPVASGTVEIGYEIAPEYRSRGFATEAARGGRSRFLPRAGGGGHGSHACGGERLEQCIAESGDELRWRGGGSRPRQDMALADKQFEMKGASR